MAKQQTAATKTKAASPWGFDKSDIVPDPAVRFGILPNGMRYAIMANKTPVANASIRMRFDIGSTAEVEDQRGLAHFLEHMAFNGSKNVPEGEMVKLLERMGLAFGPDTNASTGFTETIYMLDLPQVGDTYIDTGLKLMRETAGELTINPAAVDRERGVVLSEMRARESFGLRQFKDQSAFFAPGTAISKGLPIGNEAVLKLAPAQRIRDFYESYYTPNRATLVVVGDFDPAKIEANIKAKFSNWKAKRSNVPAPDLGTIDPARPFSVDTFIDADVPTSVTIATMRPYVKEVDSAALRKKQLLEGLGSGIVNRRLARLVRQPDARFAGAGMGNGAYLSTAQAATLSIIAKDRDWKAALGIGEQELRRALQYGFTQAELAEQLANMATALKNTADQSSTRKSAALASGIVGTLEEGSVFATPQSSLDRFTAMAPSITAQDVTNAFRSLWTGVNPLIHVAHNAAIDGDTKTVIAALAQSSKIAVAAPVSETKALFAYTNFGTPGKIADDSRVADLDIRTLRFANGVRLNVKRTDFEKGRVRVSLRVGGGELELPKPLEGAALFVNTAFVPGGTKAHSNDELQSILAGRQVSGVFGAGGSAFGGTVATTPQDLEIQLQVLAALMSAPGYRPEGETQWRNLVGVFLPTLDSQPGGVAARDVPRILANGDTRFGIPGEAALKARTFAEVKPVLDAVFASGPIEIGIVGDVGEEDAIKAVAATFGALSARQSDRPDYVNGNPVAFPVSRAPITLNHSGKPDQAMAMVYWPTTDNGDFREEQTLDLLSEVMGNMLTDELREKMGATYSPNAASFMSDLYKGYGYLSASLTAEPGRIDEVYTAIDAIADKLRAAPPSDDLIIRARTPMLERLSRSRRENATWIGLIDEAQSLPRDLDNFRAAETMLKSLTATDLQKAAARYLDKKLALRIRIVPRPAK